MLFHARHQQLQTTLVDETGRAILDQLERLPATPFAALADSLPDIPPDELLWHCRTLAGQGLLAIA